VGVGIAMKEGGAAAATAKFISQLYCSPQFSSQKTFFAYFIIFYYCPVYVFVLQFLLINH